MSLYIHAIQAVAAANGKRLDSIWNKVLRMNLDNYVKQAQAFTDLVSGTVGWKPAKDDDNGVCLDWYEESSLCPVTLPDGNTAELHFRKDDGRIEAFLLYASEDNGKPSNEFALTEFRIRDGKLVIRYEEKADIDQAFSGKAIRGTMQVTRGDSSLIGDAPVRKDERQYLEAVLDYATDKKLPYGTVKVHKTVAVPDEAFSQ